MPDLLARSDPPMAQRRIGGDAGAEQRRHAGQIELVGNPQHESLVDDDRVGIASKSRAADHFVDAVVGWVEAPFAILLQALTAGTASAAGIDHAADSGEVARLEKGRFGAGLGHPADNFMSRKARVDRIMPFVAGLMQVGMANAAIENFDLDVLRSGVAAVE